MYRLWTQRRLHQHKWGVCHSTNLRLGGGFPRRPGRSCHRPQMGFTDKSGTVVIKPEYEADILDHFKFSEGLAAVKVDGKWGYIDKTGQLAIKPAFEGADPFSEGLAASQIDHKNGYINAVGELVIKPRFDLAVEFSEGLARVNIGWTYGLNSTDPGYRQGKWGFIDR